MSRCALMLLLYCLSLAGARAVEWPSSVTRYLETLHQIEQTTEPVALETLFTYAGAVQDAVMLIENDKAWLETLDDSEFRALSRALRGLRLSRGYDIYAQPDPVFWLALAQQRGHEADRAFFALYQRSWGEDLIPSYLRQTARISPCVRFGENVIADLYAGWTAFRLAHPQAYVDYANQTVLDLEEVVVLGTCACGDQASVERELNGFSQQFPLSPVKGSILQRLQQLKDDPDRLPVNCR
ncbi:MAG: hypothetical protein ACT4PG_14850 [Panacagrimonas sp.]